MAQILLDMRSARVSGDIQSAEVIFSNNSDRRRSQYFFINPLPAGDLRAGIRLAKAEDLADNQNFSIIVRVFDRSSQIINSVEIQTNSGRETCRGRLFWRRCTESRVGITANI